MPEITLPTKAKQDDTNTKVTDIQTKTNTINTNVNTLLAGRVVKSVQRGTVNLHSSRSDITITISSVNVSKTFILIDRSKFDSNTDYDASISCRLVNSTSLRLYGYSENTSDEAFDVNVDWQVIEFY